MLYLSSDPRVCRPLSRHALGSFCMAKKCTRALLLAFICGLFFSAAPHARAVEKTALSSASLTTIDGVPVTQDDTYFAKRVAIQNVLRRYDSDLIVYADAFVESAYRHDLNPYLLVSISGLESYFGRFMVPGTHNGYGWGGGYIEFESWEDGIETISAALRRNYYNKGAETIHDVGRKYAESPTWSVRVSFFISQFEQEEAKVRQIITVL